SCHRCKFKPKLRNTRLTPLATAIEKLLAVFSLVPAARRLVATRLPPTFRQRCSIRQCEREQCRTGGNGDVLPAVNLVAHRPRVDLAANGSLPQQLTGAGIERDKIAILAAAEHHATGG